MAEAVRETPRDSEPKPDRVPYIAMGMAFVAILSAGLAIKISGRRGEAIPATQEVAGLLQTTAQDYETEVIHKYGKEKVGEPGKTVQLRMYIDGMASIFEVKADQEGRIAAGSLTKITVEDVDSQGVPYGAFYKLQKHQGKDGVERWAGQAGLDSLELETTDSTDLEKALQAARDIHYTLEKAKPEIFAPPPSDKT